MEVQGTCPFQEHEELRSGEGRRLGRFERFYRIFKLYAFCLLKDFNQEGYDHAFILFDILSVSPCDTVPFSENYLLKRKIFVILKHV